ncbi:MAG: hypothetical protein GY928_29805, partial [Colwellia sp.]|nr:hypothetical protein [Colwellia sp.]
MSAQWEDVADLGQNRKYWIPSGINKDNYICITDSGQSQIAIHKYDVETNEWREMYHQIDDYKYASTALDIKNQIIYTVVFNKVKQIDLNNNTLLTHNVENDHGIKWHSKIIVLNNSLYVLGGDENSILKWDSNKKIWTKVTDMFNEGKLANFGLVYLKKTNSLLLFGGFDYTNNQDSDSILEFELSTNKWNKLSVTLPKKMDSAHCLMAMNNKYVLIFGGYDNDGNGWSDNIFIFCIKNKTIKKSNIKCPSKGIFSGVTVGDKEKDKKAVFGYVRKEWKLCEISDHCFPP